MGSRGEAGCSAGVDGGRGGASALRSPPLASQLPARTIQSRRGRGEAAQMPARPPPRQALAPLLPPLSISILPGGSAKASAGQRQGRGRVPPAASGSRGLPLPLLYRTLHPSLYRRFCITDVPASSTTHLSQPCPSCVWCDRHSPACHSSLVPPRHLAPAPIPRGLL